MKLKKYLEKNKISGYAFCKMLGIDMSYAYRLINGQRTPSLSLCKKIQTLTEGEVSPQDFFPN